MTFADFLAQVTAWQWIGLIVLAAIVADGASHFRLWGNITKIKNEKNDEKGQE